MNRLFDLLRIGLAPRPEATDKKLLDRFIATRDESAFAELVQRYASLVWGVCRRRCSDHDAEDAFQATFLVLLRRANQLRADDPLGSWLHRVATMTVRNIARGNRRRLHLSGVLEHDVAAAEALSPLDRIALDEALLTLPDCDRAAVVMCHLRGLSRRDAAARLGCPEGTLSARLSRALKRLRARLEDVPAVVGTGGVVAMPAGLSASVVRLGMIDTTSKLIGVGVSPAVAGLTNGVLRMFWMKKLMSALAIIGFVTGGLLVGLMVRPGLAASAIDPLPLSHLAEEPRSPARGLEEDKQTIDKRLKELTKQAAEIEESLKKVNAEKAKLEKAQKEKLEVAQLNGCLDIVCRGPSGERPLYTVREVIGEKVCEISCNELDILATYLMRAFRDPKGPKSLIVHARANVSQDQSDALLLACAQAGYAKATFFKSLQGTNVATVRTVTETPVLKYAIARPLEQESEIDLKKLLAPKKQ